MNRTSLLIVGLGGVGGYYGGLLAKKYAENPDVRIYFMARGEHLKEVKENGLKLITEAGTFVVRPTLITDKATDVGKVDYVIITTKSYDLASTIEQIKPCLKDDTVILPLLNGADISHRIRKIVPGVEVWNGCCYIVSRRKEPGIVESSGGIHDLFFGLENQTSERLLWMEKFMKDAGIPAVFSQNIRMIIWRKFIFISATASLTSYYDVGFRDLLTDDVRRKTTIDFLTEVALVAKAEGVVFENDIIATTIRHIEKLPFGTTSSMHTDFKMGRETELYTLTGIVVELARKHGIPTPTYEKVYDVLSNLHS